MADVQASRWFHTLAPGLRDDPAPPRTPAADARSFGKSFGGPLRLCLLPCGPSCEDESSLTSPKSVLDLPPSLDMVAGAGAARGADRHLLRSQSEADDEGDGDSPASAATSPPPSAFASLAATSPTSPTAPTAPASSVGRVSARGRVVVRVDRPRSAGAGEHLSRTGEGHIQRAASRRSPATTARVRLAP